MARASAIVALALCLAATVSATTVIDNYQQCGGMGADCGKAEACADAIYPDSECKAGWSCQRQNGYYWQCLKGTSPPVVTNVSLPLYAQCGGKGGTCSDEAYSVCEDKAYPSASCSSGATCQRQNEYYWQCLAPSEDSTDGEDNTDSEVETTDDLAEFDQCGGMGGDCGKYGDCTDGEYTAHKCASGLTCERQNEYYRQCLSGTVPSPEPNVVPVEIPQYGQCGGNGGNCTTADYGACADAAYPNTACHHGTHCARQDEYYWQCL